MLLEVFDGKASIQRRVQAGSGVPGSRSRRSDPAGGHGSGVHEGVLGRWVRELKGDPKQAFPGRGKLKPDDAEVARLKRELSKTRMELGILKKK